MDIVRGSKVLIDAAARIINISMRAKYLFEYRKYATYLKKNEELRDKHKGETCYILGNGPSMKQLTPEFMIGKKTFCVNAFYKSEMYNIIKPTYHCCYDKFIFQDCKERLDEITTNNKYCTKFILNRRAIGQLKNENDCYFVYSTILPTTHNHYYDLTKNANTFLNVIPFAIMCAIYMGFTNIILLGCDFSLFASRKNAHFYDVGTDAERKESLFQELQAHAIVCCQHECLKRFSKERGITILNATPNSLLDVYPQVKIEDYV